MICFSPRREQVLRKINYQHVMANDSLSMSSFEDSAPPYPAVLFYMVNLLLTVMNVRRPKEEKKTVGMLFSGLIKAEVSIQTFGAAWPLNVWYHKEFEDPPAL